MLFNINTDKPCLVSSMLMIFFKVIYSHIGFFLNMPVYIKFSITY